MKAYVVEKIEDKKFESGIQDIEIPIIEENEINGFISVYGQNILDGFLHTDFVEAVKRITE